MSVLFTVASIYLACALALVAIIDHMVGFIFRAPPPSRSTPSSATAKIGSQPQAAPQE